MENDKGGGNTNGRKGTRLGELFVCHTESRTQRRKTTRKGYKHKRIIELKNMSQPINGGAIVSGRSRNGQGDGDNHGDSRFDDVTVTSDGEMSRNIE